MSASGPSTWKRDFAVTPVIDFTSESDPNLGFTSPQPQGADEKPLSEMSVSEAQELKDALLESIAKCMQIQSSLYRLVLVKLRARVKDAGENATLHFESRELQLNKASSVSVTEMNVKDSPDPSIFNNPDVEEGFDVSLNDTTKTPKMKSLDDSDKSAGKEEVEMTTKILSKGNLEDTPGSLPEAPSLGILEDNYPSLNTGRTEQHSNTAPGSFSSLDDTGATLNDTPDATLENQKGSHKYAFETLLNELTQPLQALNRCTLIQRDLFQKLIMIVNAFTSNDGAALSGMR